MRKVIALVGVIAAIAFPAVAGECAPKHTLKIVTAAESEGDTLADLQRRAATLYRLGSDHGRLEEADHPLANSRMLFIMNGENIWIANLRDKTGQHVVGQERPPVMHASVLSIDSKLWKQFEMGCEEPFMKAVHAHAEEAADGGTKYTYAAEGTTVTLLVRHGTPQRVDVTTAEAQYTIRYLAYETVADPPADLFEKPAGITFSEASPR